MGTTATITDEPALEGAPRTDKPAALLRGSARGLEIVIEAPAGLDAIIDTIDARLAEAPTFFKGSDVRVQVKDGPLPAGSLGLLEELARSYQLTIVEISAAKPERKVKDKDDAIPPAPVLAIGSGGFDDVPTAEGEAIRAEEFGDIPTQILPSPPNAVVMATAMALAPALGTHALVDAFASARKLLTNSEPAAPVVAMPVEVKPEPVKAPVIIGATAPNPVGATAPNPIGATAPNPIGATAPNPVGATAPNPIESDEPEIEIDAGTRVVVGPVRSGVILDHRGHVIVFGDVNPGAEVRAAGNIVVLGKLKGLAHAGIGAETGFIVALHLQPQQLRIGRTVARSNDKDTAAAIPEIAYITNGSIVVERYTGKLAPGLAASLS